MTVCDFSLTGNPISPEMLWNTKNLSALCLYNPKSLACVAFRKLLQEDSLLRSVLERYHVEYLDCSSPGGKYRQYSWLSSLTGIPGWGFVDTAGNVSMAFTACEDAAEVYEMLYYVDSMAARIHVPAGTVDALDRKFRRKERQGAFSLFRRKEQRFAISDFREQVRQNFHFSAIRKREGFCGDEDGCSGSFGPVQMTEQRPVKFRVRGAGGDRLKSEFPDAGVEHPRIAETDDFHIRAAAEIIEILEMASADDGRTVFREESAVAFRLQVTVEQCSGFRSNPGECGRRQCSARAVFLR